MIFGIKSYELPDLTEFRVKLYWGVLNRVRIAVMGKIAAGVLLALPIMLLVLDTTLETAPTPAYFKGGSFLFGLFLLPVIYFCEKPEFLHVILDRNLGVFLVSEIFGFQFVLKEYSADSVADVAIKCEFEYAQIHQTAHNLLLLFKDGHILKVCLAYTLSPSPDNELLRIARACAEVFRLTQPPAILGNEPSATERDPNTGFIRFKGVRFAPRSSVV